MMSRPLSRRGVGVQNCQWGSWALALGACYDGFSILLARRLCSNLLLDVMLWRWASGACYDESSTVQARGWRSQLPVGVLGVGVGPWELSMMSFSIFQDRGLYSNVLLDVALWRLALALGAC